MARFDQKYHSISKLKIINYLIFIFFCLYFFIGINIYKDYGITTDEPFQRTAGFYWYLWIINNFSNDISNLDYLKNTFNKMEWSQDMLKGTFLEYGAIFDLFAVFLESKFNIKNSQDFYYLKHFLNFSTFYISSICFFYLIKFRFKNKLLALIGVFFYITSPRIFAESFYNSKDIIFMSLAVFSIFFGMKVLKNYKLKNIILFSFFSALATDVRIMGIFFIFLFLIFFIFESLEIKNFFKKKIKFILITVFFYFLFVYIFWPYLWLDPINNFIIAFKSFKNYGWGGSIFYLGEYIDAQHLPWHYSFVWIGISIPLIYMFLFLVGAIKIFLNFFQNFLKIDKDDLSQKLWPKFSDKLDFFALIFFLGPIVAVVVFGSTLYNGWRHLYFIYPALIYMSIFGLNYILNLKIHNFVVNSIFLITFFSILINVFNLIKLHPYQNIYFNFLVEKKANSLFEIDYWGAGNAYAIKKILDDREHSKEISIRTASFTPLGYSKYIINSEKLKNVNFSGNDALNQDYIFTNFIYEADPKFLKKYFISENYEKFFTLKRGNIIINEIYKKK